MRIFNEVECLYTNLSKILTQVMCIISFVEIRQKELKLSSGNEKVISLIRNIVKKSAKIENSEIG